jgi:carbamoyltransferase
MIVLGLNVFHPDSSASILVNGKIIATMEEERLVRIKHFHGFPFQSINFCLKKSKLNISDVDFITVNYDPLYNLKPRIISSIKNIFNKKTFSRIGKYLKKKNLNNLIKIHFPKFRGKIINVPHHLSHASSTFLCSGMKDSVTISIDGVGDFSSMEIYKCNKDKLELLYKSNFPHSLGIFYQTMTQFIGFKNYGDEYKLMGLAAYGQPKFKNQVYELIKFEPPFDFKLNLNYFNHHTFNDFFEEIQGVPYFDNLFSEEMFSLFGENRNPNEPLTQFHKDLAASVQFVFEDIVLNICKNIYIENHSDNLCLSGGCIFNSLLVGKIIDQNLFKNIYIQPNCGDAGGALGSALYYSNVKLDKFENKKLSNVYFGSKYSEEEIENRLKNFQLDKLGYKYKKYENFNEICEIASEFINKYKVIAWFQDESEWGPRALGNRSFLADPREKEIKNVINKKIKLRDEFRPFAPSVLSEFKNEYFEVKDEFDYYHMTAVIKAKEITKNNAPGIVHQDGTSRIQSVSDELNSKFSKLLKSFQKKYNLPILLNTSFNVNEPIVESPEDAIKCFVSTKLEVMVINNFIVEKI